jgi:hypothetical protein
LPPNLFFPCGTPDSYDDQEATLSLVRRA